METDTRLGTYNAGTDNQLAIDVSRDDSTVVIRLVGDLDCDVELGAMDVILRAAESPDFRALHVDVKGVTFIDSSGVTCLLLARQTAIKNELGYTLHFAGNDAVTRVLDVCGLTRVFEGDGSSR